MSIVAALALLAGMGWLGVALLDRWTTGLTTLERGAYGAPLGVVVSSLALLVVACFAGRLGVVAVAVTGVMSAAAAAVFAASRWLRGDHSDADDGPRDTAWVMSLGAALLLAAFIVRWALLWHDALTIDGHGLWASLVNLWGDWALHLGDVTSFVYGDNFPPGNPRLAGHVLSYHYLTSVTVAAMVRLGMSPVAALLLHSFIFSVAILLGLFAFARRLTSRNTDAALAVVLFLLGGGLGWWLTLHAAWHAPSPVAAFWQQPWNRALQQSANIQWQNIYLSLIAPQRAYLYGLPLALLILTLLYQATRRNGRRELVIAGVVAGLLPFAHLGALLALALITPWIFLLCPGRRWMWFFATWVAIAVPQLYLQQGGGAGAAAALRLQIGWMAGHDAWPWFWFKNLGLFLPLLAIALWRRELLPEPSHRFLVAFMPAFVLANLFVFQPWDWDNTKVFAFWFLGVSVLVASLVAGLWRAHRNALVRTALGVAVASMVLSGLLVNLFQFLGRDRNLMASTDALRLATAVRVST
ncbi:MAG: hypothetical protein ACRENC_06475, partial [Gemmatimonadaceae bacterium]